MLVEHVILLIFVIITKYAEKVFTEVLWNAHAL